MIKLRIQLLNNSNGKEAVYLFYSKLPSLMLMNKLYEEKRYDDVLAVFYRFLDKLDLILLRQTTRLKKNSDYNEETRFRIDFLASEAVDIFADVLTKKVIIKKFTYEFG